MTREEEVFLDQKKAELVVKLYNMFGVILESKPLLKEDFYNWLETILIHHAMLLDSNKHEPQVIASERSSANGAVADIVLTIQEIYNLAVYAGLVINEKNSTDDRESEIAIKENMTIKMSDGEWKGRGAYYTDYPEDKAVIIKEY